MRTLYEDWTCSFLGVSVRGGEFSPPLFPMQICNMHASPTKAASQARTTAGVVSAERSADGVPFRSCPAGDPIFEPVHPGAVPLSCLALIRFAASPPHRVRDLCRATALTHALWPGKAGGASVKCEIWVCHERPSHSATNFFASRIAVLSSIYPQLHHHPFLLQEAHRHQHR